MYNRNTYIRIISDNFRSINAFKQVKYCIKYSMFEDNKSSL